MRIKDILPFLEGKIVIITEKYEKELAEVGYEIVRVGSLEEIPKDARTIILSIEDFPKEKELDRLLERVKSSDTKFLVIYGRDKIVLEDVLKKLEGFELGRKTEDVIILFRKPKRMKEEIRKSEMW